MLKYFIWIMRFALLGMVFVFLYKIVKVMYTDLKGGEARNHPLAGIEIVEVNDEVAIPVGSVYPLHPVTNLGRMGDNTIVLDSQYVSSYHARIYAKNNAYILKDMGSTNGTYLNGEKVDKPVVIKGGDSIGIGGIIFKVIG